MSSSTFTAACATGPDWQTIVDRCLADLDAGGFPASLGWLYVTEELAPELDGLLARLRARTGVHDWVGTVGAGICCTGREIYDEPAAAIMLAHLPDDSVRLIPPGVVAMNRMLDQNRGWIDERGARFAIVHGDPRCAQLTQLIESLAETLDPGFLVGGLTSAGDDENNIQIAGEMSENALSGVLLASDIPVVTGLTQGVAPLGMRHIVTECRNNILVTLDNRPALDVFREDIGDVLSRDLSRVAGYIFAGLPVRGSDTGDYLVRNLVGIDPEQKLVAIGDLVGPGDPIMFCRRDGDSAREDMLRMLDDLGRRAGDQPRAGIYYTCLGRGRHQFGENSVELNMIRDRLGDFPLVGFFCNGEISHNRLYGYTGVLTLFV
jgi:small ligand-binding sensory domain FIST